jgi:putative aldouronate transport system substrate-binding protein
MFWNVSPYLKDYPSFKDINPIVVQNASIDGKLYGIPRERPLIRRVITIRKDWLEKLHLNPPGTLDELYTVAKAFATRDPDGNGKQDTVGLAVGVNPVLEGLDVVAVANGAPNFWGERNGKLVPMFMTPEFFGAMNWYKKLYDEKILNQDFVTVKDSYTDFLENEKTGIIFDWVCSYKGDPLYEAKMKADPTVKDGDLIDQYFLKATDGSPRIPSERGILGLLAFPKASVKTEAELKRVLASLSKLDDKIAQDLMTWGLEGVHYQLKNGLPVILDAAAKKSVVEPMAQLGFALSGDRTQRYISYEGDPALARVMALAAKDLTYVVPDLSTPLISDTYGTKSAEFDQLWNDAVVKYIVGMINEAQWNQTIDQWKKMGGDKIIEEYTAAYVKAKAQ